MRDVVADWSRIRAQYQQQLELIKRLEPKQVSGHVAAHSLSQMLEARIGQLTKLIAGCVRDLTNA